MNALTFRQKVFRFRRFARKSYAVFNSLHRVVNIGVVASCMLTFAHSMESVAQTVSATGIRGDLAADQELDEVVVKGSRIDLTLGQVARQVTVITRKEIERAPAQSIQDLLNYTAGVDVLQRSGHGVQADISIRGGSFDQTAILLNGINLSNPQTGHFSFDIPVNLNDIERIEIIHGPSSLIYGAGAFSGGINIVTKKRAGHKLYGKAQAGSHALFGVETGVTMNGDVVANSLSAGYNRSDGYRANTDYDLVNALWQTSLQTEEYAIGLQTGYNGKQFGANAFYTPKYPNQYEETESWFVSVKGETRGRLKLTPSVYWSRHLDCFQLFRDGTPDIPEWYGGHNYHRTDVYGANLNFQYTSLLGATLLGAEFRNEGIASSVLGMPMREPDGRYTRADNRTNISYALEHTVITKRLVLTAGLLANLNTALRDDYRFYPSAGGSYKVTDNLKAYANWSKATRMPTFTDLYYNTDTHSGNADLKPEYSESFELGWKYSDKTVRGGLTGFIMKGDNLIDWIQENPDGKWQSVNLATISKKGLEAGFGVNLAEVLKVVPERARLRLGYVRMYQDGENVSGEVNSNYVLNYLRDKFTAVLYLPLYREVVTAGWSFRWQKRMGSYAKYDPETKTSVLTAFPAFSTLDFRLDWKVTERLKANLDINNLYDTRYLDLGNLPQAGFRVMTGLTFTL